MTKIHIVTREFTTKDIPNVATGMTDKYWNAARAIDVNITHELSGVSGIVLFDPLWLWELAETEERWEQFQELDAIKIIWAEEQELLRWTRKRRMEFVNASDLVATCNKFLQNLLSHFGIKSDVLYTHIDENFFRPSTKEPYVVASGKVSVAKGVERIIELYKELDCDKYYIGHSELWGEEPPSPQQEANKALEKELSKYCQWIPYATRNDMRDLLSPAAVYLNLSRYDVGCLTAIQSGMSGCHLVLWDEHRQFDEYFNVTRSSNLEHTFCKVNEFIENPTINDNIRQEMISKHGYEAFRANLNAIISKCIGI